MLDRRLLLRLVLPLVIVALVSTLLIWPPSPKDFLSNLIVEIAGILITVLFVDWLLHSREREKWEHTDTLIKANFAAWAIRFVAETTLFLAAGGWTPPESTKATSPDRPWSLVLEQAAIEDMHSALLNATPKHRKSFTQALQQWLQDLIQLHTRHAIRLSAEEASAVLELESALRSVQIELFLVELSDGDPARLEAIGTEGFQRASEALNDAVRKAIEVFGNFGFPMTP
jgi:hypothetical protein